MAVMLFMLEYNVNLNSVPSDHGCWDNPAAVDTQAHMFDSLGLEAWQQTDKSLWCFYVTQTYLPSSPVEGHCSEANLLQSSSLILFE